MLKKVLQTAIVSLGLVGISMVVIPQATHALSTPHAYASFQSDACKGLTQIDDTQDCNNNGSGLTKIVAGVVNILSIIVGAAAIIMIIVSGFKYITSGGDASRVSSAKSTLVYALVGVAIAAVAQFLVHFVLTRANDATPCPSNPSISRGNDKCK